MKIATQHAATIHRRRVAEKAGMAAPTGAVED
jgi:hypothetical protein